MWMMFGQEISFRDPARHSNVNLTLSRYTSSDSENGEGGIRTRGAGVSQHDGLANRWPKPLTDETTEAYDPDTDALTAALTVIRAEHPHLVEVATAWPDLPESIRAGILAIVRVAQAAQSESE